MWWIIDSRGQQQQLQMIALKTISLIPKIFPLLWNSLSFFFFFFAFYIEALEPAMFHICLRLNIDY